MKLRVQGNSIRFRLLRSEVAGLVRTGYCEETVSFGPADGERLTYAIEVAQAYLSVGARFARNRITISVPPSTLREWAATDQVSIEATQLVGDGVSLKILIEKDFKCLDRDDPTNADAFERPESSPPC